MSVISLISCLLSACGDTDEISESECRYDGKINCPCLEEDLCYQSENGLQMMCVEGICQEPVCEDSSLKGIGCLCDITDNTADKCEEDLICVNGNCVVDTGQTLDPPENPICFTPCKGEGVTLEDGTYIACSEQGLLPTCIDGATCIDGSCQLVLNQTSNQLPDSSEDTSEDSSEEVVRCITNFDCSLVEDDRTLSCIDSVCQEAGCQADDECGEGERCLQGECQSYCDNDDMCTYYQACIQNKCYSDCQVDGVNTCRGSRQCYRNVCRVPCDPQGTNNGECEQGYSCERNQIDVSEGYCMPNGVPPQGPVESSSTQQTVLGSNLALSERVLNSIEEGLEYGLKPDYLEDTELDEPFIGFNFAPKDEEGQFIIRNHSRSKHQFVIRKLNHTEYGDRDPVVVENSPLHWITLGQSSVRISGEQVDEDESPSLERANYIEVELEENEEVTLYLGEIQNDLLTRWTGQIQVEVVDTGVTKKINLEYTGSIQGQWSGKMYIFANFNDQGLDEWRNNPTRSNLQLVSNAFIRRWVAFKEQRLSLNEFKAMLRATITGSWNFESVRQQCPNKDHPNPNVACYLYDNPSGISIYSNFLPETPIPSGVLELPFDMNIKNNDENDPFQWVGRLDSTKSLHYIGNPQVNLEFHSNPNDCSHAKEMTSCIHFLSKFEMTSLVGGRFKTDINNQNCSNLPNFELVEVPWLLFGFQEGTQTDALGKRYYYECRDSSIPFGLRPDVSALNKSMSIGNPIPDGKSRERTVELVDGVMVDQNVFYMIYKETFPSFLGQNGEDFVSYGVIELLRSNVALTEADYQGNDQTQLNTQENDDQSSIVDDCDGLVDVELNENNASLYALALVKGFIPNDPTQNQQQLMITQGSEEKVHYLCADTDVFNGGPLDDGTATPDQLEECPEESEVIYFTLRGPGSSMADLANEPCQNSQNSGRAGEIESCQETLNGWIQYNARGVRLNPIYLCTDPSVTYCDDNRANLREGKSFFSQNAGGVYDQSLDHEIADAFRYKIRFQTRNGRSIGFTPDLCIPNSNAIPYCYDPKKIEKIEKRVNCATYVYTQYYNDLGEYQNENTRQVLKDYLVQNFSYEEVYDTFNRPRSYDGFERLNAELLILLGDESYISAFKSRFDLVGQNIATFEGSLFEPNGIDLSGVAGYEMYSLYQATQYYQKALDRFYLLSSIISDSFDLPNGEGFITAQSVTSYFTKLIRASSQKTRVWSEISKKYQLFNRPDLARRVIERAYISAYLESIILSQLMLSTIELPNSATQAQIELEVKRAQLVYSAALMDMLNVYQDISDDLTFFGIPPDYIPFPALYPTDKNAFYKLFEITQQKMLIAREKETRALEDNRSFEVDSASFQAEISNISREYNNQLSEICGTFEASDGLIYPAIPKYAELSDETVKLGDPCGLVGNGQLYNTLINASITEKDINLIIQREQNVQQEIKDVKQRVQTQCKRLNQVRDFRLQKENEIISLNNQINGLRTTIFTLGKTLETVQTITGHSKCSVRAGLSTDLGSDCISAGVVTGIYLAASSSLTVASIASEVVINTRQQEIQEIQKSIVLSEYENQCQAMKIDVNFTIKELFRRLLEVRLEAEKQLLSQKLVFSEIQKLSNQARMLMAQQSEAEELSINVQAARNDPNVRIYRNDKIINADRTFYEALVSAYRLTKIFEYYTSQSYPDIIKLQLSRMIAHGDYSLESYIAEIEQEFYLFEEQYGIPDLRQEVISLKRDIFNISELDIDGTGTSVINQTGNFVSRLTDPNLLDENGYIVIPFSTNLNRLSPLTRNHKIQYIEVDISGGGVGDRLGRIYLKQTGTGIISSITDEEYYFVLPERVAVVNVSVGGTKKLEPDYYKNERLRDFPVVNTSWELIINTKDEAVNQDIDLTNISDIRIFIYYSDFTVY